MCPDGKEYPLSMIRVDAGRWIWKMFFRSSIIRAVAIEVVARRIALDFCLLV